MPSLLAHGVLVAVGVLATLSSTAEAQTACPNSPYTTTSSTTSTDLKNLLASWEATGGCEGGLNFAVPGTYMMDSTWYGIGSGGGWRLIGKVDGVILDGGGATDFIHTQGSMLYAENITFQVHGCDSLCVHASSEPTTT